MLDRSSNNVKASDAAIDGDGIAMVTMMIRETFTQSRHR